MTDRDKVIKALEECQKSITCSKDCPCYDNSIELAAVCEKALMRDALALLKEQEVIPHKNYANLDMWWCECGWCLGKRGTFNYCPNCGKAVKWE